MGYGSSSTTATTDAYVSTLAIPLPSGSAAGELVAIGVVRWEASNPAFSNISGSTSAGAQAVNGNEKLAVFWKRLVAGDISAGTLTFAWTGSQYSGGQIVRVTAAVASGDPVGTYYVTATANSATVPTTSFSTSTIPTLAVHFVSHEDSRTHTAPTGVGTWTEVQDGSYLATNYRVPSATGTLTASGGALTGGASLMCAAMVAFEPVAGGSSQNADAALSGTGTLTATGASTKPAGATLTANGSRSAAGTSTKPVDASLVVAGSVTATADTVKPAVAALTAVASLTAEASVGAAPLSAAATLAGTGSITATAAADKPVATALAATVTAVPSAASTKPVDASLSGSVAVTAAAASTKPAAGALAGVGTITADATVGAAPVGAAATLTGLATLTASVERQLVSAGALTALGNVTATCAVTKPIGGSLAALATVSPAIAKTAPAAATLVALATLMASGQVQGPVTRGSMDPTDRDATDMHAAVGAGPSMHSTVRATSTMGG
jgi:hypothetical protein